ncbi:hypothetical protein GF391_00670 [Candidatus Uhrbacteria bacterium]|nr:hypothetical protein [Candidatus Uhrbacteria bacterium]
MFEETVFYSETASGGLSTFNLIGAILLGCLVLILLIVAIIWLKKKLSRPELYGLTREEVAKRWQQIMATSKQNGDMGLKLAIIEADNLLDAALKSLVMQGDTLGERLKFACYKYPKLKNVWWAHKLRNNLVHDHSFRLNAGQAKKALGEFEKALKELKIL